MWWVDRREMRMLLLRVVFGIEPLEDLESRLRPFGVVIEEQPAPRVVTYVLSREGVILAEYRFDSGKN